MSKIPKPKHSRPHHKKKPALQNSQLVCDDKIHPNFADFHLFVAKALRTGKPPVNSPLKPITARSTHKGARSNNTYPTYPRLLVQGLRLSYHNQEIICIYIYIYIYMYIYIYIYIYMCVYIYI